MDNTTAYIIGAFCGWLAGWSLLFGVIGQAPTSLIFRLLFQKRPRSVKTRTAFWEQYK